MSLLRLSEAQAREFLSEPAIRSATQAATLFRSLGQVANEGRALRLLAAAHSHLGHAAEANQAAGEALALGRSCGDLYGVGNALNMLMLNEADLGTNLRLLNQALAAFEAAGYLERQGLITSNLGFAYRSLGLHRRARRLYVQAGTIFRATGLVDRDDIALELATVEMEMGRLEAARTYLAEAATAASAVPNNQFLHFYMPMMFGRLATLEGDSPTALKHYKRALKLLRNVEQPAFEMNALARLAQVHLAMGSPGPALAATRRATTMHRALDLAALQVLNAPLVWWRHSQALYASGQAASAREALEMAYRFLQNGISGLSDEGLRRNYLNKSRERREIIAAFQANGQPLEALTQEYVRVAAALTELRHA